MAKKFFKFDICDYIDKRSQLVLGIAVPIILLWVFLFSPPSDFPLGKLVKIEEGSTLTSISKVLKAESIVRNDTLFTALTSIIGGKTGAKSGYYDFSEPQNVIYIAWRIANGDYGIENIKVTIPEGTSVVEMAEIFAEKLIDFDKQKFIDEAISYEGYLFPDTYFLAPDIDEKELTKMLIDTFNGKVATILKDIEEFGRPLDEVIKMASYLEEEARTEESRRIIAGILWKRLDMEMPFQIDVTLKYYTNKNSFQLTKSDLKEDDPFNTYTRKGFTPTPISSPGLKSIKAAIDPIKTPYLFYLSDDYGTMHYAVTHDEHVSNKDRYIR